MIIDAKTLEESATLEATIAIVGAGPAGIVLALELAQAGHTVMLLESGDLEFSEAAQDLGEASHFDPNFHAPMSECTRRQLGGTSVIWGGRCVPYDPIDFDQRDHIPNSSWPVTYSELEGYFQRACSYFFCGKASFDIGKLPHIAQKSIIPDLPDEAVLTSTLERWSLPTNFGKEYFQALQQSDHIRLVHSLTCTAIEVEGSGSRVAYLKAKTGDRKTIHIKARHYILAAGALNTARLLLASDQKHAGGIGNHSGHLGRFYMGHLSGEIAIACFKTPPEKTLFAFDRDADNTYVRRRFSFTREFQQQEKLTNVVAWLGTPKFDDPSHRNGIFSFAYLALSSPFLGKYLVAKAIRKSAVGDGEKGVYWQHIRNVLQDFGQTAAFIPTFGFKRYIARRKIPALFVYSASNEYYLHYHAEQVPNFASAVSLADEVDEVGVRRLNIDLRYSSQDIEGVVRAHHHWDQHLRKHNCGYLKYLTDDLESSVWTQALDGFHQNGTTRMSEHPNDGVVSPNCNIHGFDNLFVASSSIFVTSGQANSTFMIVAFALRLADYLKEQMRQ